jgi:glutaredoxin 3
MSDLVLYMRPTCPYCRKVMTFMDKQDISIPMRDVSRDPAAHEELVRTGGMAQVPCLFIDGKPMYESDDIIAYLRKEYSPR